MFDRVLCSDHVLNVEFYLFIYCKFIYFGERFNLANLAIVILSPNLIPAYITATLLLHFWLFHLPN